MISKNQKPPVKRLKGLDSLFGSELLEPKSLTLECITLPSQQPRRYFDPEKMEQLVQSVKEYGILEPLLVRITAEAEIYELVAGERRYRAAKAAGLSEVPVVIRELSNEDAFHLALIENLQREDLNPVEETEGILQLLAFKLVCPMAEVAKILYRIQNNQLAEKLNGNVTISSELEQVEQVFAGLGLMTWESFIRNRLPLLNLPTEVIEALRQGKIAYTKAQAIAKVKDEQQRKVILVAAISEELSLSQIKERIASLTPSNAIPSDSKTLALKSRVDSAYKLVKKSQLWADPKKQKQLEELLAELEKLASSK